MTAVETTPTVVLRVYGAPQPQGSKTGFANKKTGRVTMMEGRSAAANAAFKDWREAVSRAARDWQAEHEIALIDGPVEVDVLFRLPRPKSIPKTRLWPTSRPDVDKLSRAVLDAITDIIIINDSRVCVLRAYKTYAVDEPPGCTITISVLP